MERIADAQIDSSETYSTEMTDTTKHVTTNETLVTPLKVFWNA